METRLRGANPESRRGRFGRRGFSLVEVLVMSAVGVMLLGSFYFFFIHSSTESTRLDEKVRAVQGVLLFLDRLQTDLERMVYQKGRFDVRVRSVEGGEDNCLEFYVCARTPSASDGATRIGVEKREYRYVPMAKKLYIDGRPFNAAALAGVSFRLFDEAGGARLRVGVRAVSDSHLEGNYRSGADRASDVKLSFVFGLRPVSLRRLHPFWYDMKRLYEQMDR